MTPDEQRRGDERPEDLEWRLHAMLAQRAEAVESDLSGPALRARAGHRSAVRRYLPPVAAAAAVAAVAIGIAVAASGGDGHPTRVGGSVPPGGGGTARPTTSRPHPTPSTTHQLPGVVPPSRKPGPGSLNPGSLNPGSLGRTIGRSRSAPQTVPDGPSASRSTIPRPPTASSRVGPRHSASAPS